MDRALKPLHRWVWMDDARRGRKLLVFAATEVDGGRDLARAAEVTSDPLLRRLFLRHAQDEQRHASLFRTRGHALLLESRKGAGTGFDAAWFAPGERGLDDLSVEAGADEQLLAFLHLSEKVAAGRFALYRDVLHGDPATRAVFDQVLRDEVFHMSYTRAQLVRISDRHRSRLWRARLSRFWKAYLRIAVAIAGVLGTIMLLLQYFLLLPMFAFAAKRSAAREPRGWVPARKRHPTAVQRQYG